MKAQFYLGMGLGIAAASAVLLSKSAKTDMKKALKTTRQAMDTAINKING